MGGSEENITRTEKFKITGIISVAIFNDLWLGFLRIFNLFFPRFPIQLQ
jgi:hypothetical protein